ncbi:MAG TPA: DNA repair protein RecO [Candidatus Acidoferrales bacterium]|nr:DNA repair protein RecO [Candidatus Acidoferrales bacterium]
MPLRDSEAIILQSYPLGEADRLVSFLSRSMGRVRGVAPGARKTKSRFGSTLERMSHVRIWFYERETRELVRINQCELIESFVAVFQDYASGVALTLLAEITESALPDRDPSDPAFRLLLLAARTIKAKREVELPLAYFTLWTLRLGGWLAPLDRCARCGKELTETVIYLNPVSPGWFCAACRGIGMTAISQGAMTAARGLLAERLDKISSSAYPKPVLRELLRHLLDLLEHQIERKLVAREMLETAL